MAGKRLMYMLLITASLLRAHSSELFTNSKLRFCTGEGYAGAAEHASSVVDGKLANRE